MSETGEWDVVTPGMGSSMPTDPAEEDTASAGPIIARTRTDLESATIEIELADADEAAAFFERIAAIIRKGSRVRVRVTAA